MKPFRRTTLIVAFLIALLVGLAIPRFTKTALSDGWLLVALLLIPLLFRRAASAILVVCLIGILVGYYKGGIFFETTTPYNDLFNEKVVMRGVALQDGTYHESGQLEFDISSLQVVWPAEAELPGKIRVRSFTPLVLRGDEVVVSGKLYPVRGGRQASMSYATVERVASNQNAVETFRRGFSGGVRNTLPEPNASFGLGLLIGERDSLPTEVSEDLSKAGLSHLIAVSGYNLTIIIRLIRRMLKKRSKFQIAAFSVALIAFFVACTGGSPSIVRAAWVTGLSLAMWYYGRNSKPLVMIFGVAAITAWLNPYYVWGDIGWYLSFLAFFGVLVVAPTIVGRFFPNKKPHFIVQLIIESFSAQLMVLPFILLIFNEASIIGLIANVLISPLVPFLMIGTFVSGLFGMVLPAAAWLVAVPVSFGLGIVLSLATFFASFSFAVLSRSVTIYDVMLFYGIGMAVLVVMTHKSHGRKKYFNLLE